MYISSGSKGFRPLESKMILVHVPALCIKGLEHSIIMKDICQSSGSVMEYIFYRYFLLKGEAMWSSISSEFHRSTILQVSVYLGIENSLRGRKIPFICVPLIFKLLVFKIYSNIKVLIREFWESLELQTWDFSFK